VNGRVRSTDLLLTRFLAQKFRRELQDSDGNVFRSWVAVRDPSRLQFATAAGEPRSNGGES